MGLLINIDNGGTLTDVCVIDGSKVYRTKTLTTPYDLSKCFFDGLKKVSRTVYGEENIGALLQTTDYIRYSTTQGTNALVEKKGPRMGLIAGNGAAAGLLQHGSDAREMFAALVGDRVVTIDPDLEGDAYEAMAVKGVNDLTSAGANRLVVSLGGPNYAQQEARLKRLLLRKFPSHLLGAVPIVYSHEVVDDPDDARRTWTALFNSFLHPAMERFLYSAEHILRNHKAKNPLLIFRNDGDSARVAKTIAIKTYSSGPRGGMEGAKALAAYYGFDELLSMDVGGTTTDIGLAENGVIRSRRRGEVENIPVSFPLCDVVSVGVGGSSIIKANDGHIRVGPQSVGSAPGPACFGLGGKEATITDAFLLQGVLDPASYFGGDLPLDTERAKTAVLGNLAKPLGLSLEDALVAMEQAWVKKIAESLKHYTEISPKTTLAAFGGAGPLAVCKVAEAAGVDRVIIPGLAAVFSAFGIGFSDIAHHYEATLKANSDDALKASLDELLGRARRDMFAEGFELSECQTETQLLRTRNGVEAALPLKGAALPADIKAGDGLAVALRVIKPIVHAKFAPARNVTPREALASGHRDVYFAKGGWRKIPVFRVEEQQPGASAAGPAIIEEAFFTCRLEAGWRFEVNANGDILLQRNI